MSATDAELLAAFADVLDYPRQPVAAAAARCERLAADRSADAAGVLRRFRSFAEAASLGELQEAYTRAFDLDTLSDLEPTCYPYVGHHLFDENHKRSAFLVGLNERYRAGGFDARHELPDHLVVMLRFLSRCEEEPVVVELLDEAIAPALERMTRGLAGQGSGGPWLYQRLLCALHVALWPAASSESGAASAAVGVG